MQALRIAVLTFVLLALAAVTSYAQVIAGTTFYFDHDAADQAVVEKYQLCIDTDTACQDIGVTRVGTTATVKFTLPAGVPKGRHDLYIVAVWKAPLSGASGPTNKLSQVIVGGPERLRVTEAVTP